MKESIVCAVMPDNKYRKIYDVHYKYYSSYADRKMLEDIIKMELKYPQANILIIDLHNEIILSQTISGKAVDKKINYDDYLNYRIIDDMANKKMDSLNDDIDEFQSLETDPIKIVIETDNIRVSRESYYFDIATAKEYLTKLSKENPNHNVMLCIASCIRLILKDSIVIMNNKDIPYLEDKTKHFKYFKDKWNSFD